MKGYAGKLLRVNLSAGKADSEPVALSDASDFIGGRGFVIKYLYEELAPNIDPLASRIN